MPEAVVHPRYVRITHWVNAIAMLWSAVGKWTGVPLRDFLKRIGADLSARYVHCTCSEGYSSSIDMPTALHPQTQMTLRFDDQILPARFGFPLRIRIPTKLGFKNPKHVIGMAVLNHYTGGYWEDQGQRTLEELACRGA